MTRPVRRAIVWILAIAFCLLAFYLAMTRSFEFGVADFLRWMLHDLPRPFHVAFLRIVRRLPVSEDPAAWAVRKAASIVFFGAVGVLARILASRRVRSSRGRALLVVSGAVLMSAAIEAYEWPEPLDDVALDLICGLIGGGLGVLGLKLARRL